MNLTGIAAVLALASIPVNILIARWQTRSAVAQAEAAYRSALDVAKAQHESALELLEAQHRATLVEAKVTHEHNVDLESLRLRHVAEHEGLATVVAFQDAISAFRLAFLRETVNADELHEAYNEIHDARHALRGGISMLFAIGLEGECSDLMKLASVSLEDRTEAWRDKLSPRREELNAMIARRYERR